MFVQSHFQRARHQAAGNSSTSLSLSSSAAASTAHHHHKHNHHQHHQHQNHQSKHSSSTSVGANPANNQHNHHQRHQSQVPPNVVDQPNSNKKSLRTSRLSSTSSSVNLRELVAQVTKSVNRQQTSKEKQKTSSNNSQNSLSISSGQHSNCNLYLQINSSYSNLEASKLRSRSLCSLTVLKEPHPAETCEESSLSRTTQEEAPSRPQVVASYQLTDRNHSSRRLEDDQQQQQQQTTTIGEQTERRHLLWRKIIFDCSLKLGHLLTGKLFVSSITSADATTNSIGSGQTAANSGEPSRRGKFDLISSFCMNFITYQLETWRLLVDGATSAHHYQQETGSHQSRQLRRQSSLNLPVRWAEAGQMSASMEGRHQMSVPAHLVVGQHSVDCRGWAPLEGATGLAGHPSAGGSRLAVQQHRFGRVHSQPPPEEHRLAAPQTANFGRHHPLELRHTVDGSPICGSAPAHHQVAAPTTTAAAAPGVSSSVFYAHYQQHQHQHQHDQHGQFLVPGNATGRPIGASSGTGQTLSTPTIQDELRLAEWHAQQAHLRHQYGHQHMHSSEHNHHHHQHLHNHNHNHNHRQPQPHYNSQVRSNNQQTVILPDNQHRQQLQHRQTLLRTRTEELDDAHGGRRRLAQDYGLVVDYGANGQPTIKSYVTQAANRGNSYHYYHNMDRPTVAHLSNGRPATANASTESDLRARNADIWNVGTSQGDPLNNRRIASKLSTANKWPLATGQAGRLSQTGSSVCSSAAGSIKSANSRLINGSHAKSGTSETATTTPLSNRSATLTTPALTTTRRNNYSNNQGNSSSLSKVSLAGARRRLGFKLKSGLNSLNVHRSEEVLPADVVLTGHHHHHQHSNHQRQPLQHHHSYSMNRHAKSFGSSAATTTTTTVNSFNISSDDTTSLSQPTTGKQWLSVNWSQQQHHQQQPPPTQQQAYLNGHERLIEEQKQQQQQQQQQLVDPKASFVEGLGAGQIASRQALVSPYLGDIQLGLSDQRGMLEVEVVRVRQLQAKPSAKRLPSPYVKVYLMRDKKCVAKFKTTQMCSTLDPLYQERFIFRDDYTDCVLQVIVWGDYGKKDRKSLMGLAQIHLNDVDISNLVIGWYKLFNAPSLTSTSSLSMSSSKLLRQTMSSTKIGWQEQQQQQGLYDSIEDYKYEHQQANNDDDDVDYNSEEEIDDDDNNNNNNQEDNNHVIDAGRGGGGGGGQVDSLNDMYT